MTETFASLIGFVVHLDAHLLDWAQAYGAGLLLILFLIVWAETGLVVAPFLPGDSLLFIAGAVAALVGMPLWWLMATLITAALCGDNTNYWIARRVGPAVFNRPNSRWLTPANLDATHRFYERHGGKTIIIARFVPLMRTFVPFVAGLGRMTYKPFLAYSLLGALLWVGILVPAGFWFGNVPLVKENLGLVVIAIIVASVSPLVWTAARGYLRRR